LPGEKELDEERNQETAGDGVDVGRAWLHPKTGKIEKRKIEKYLRIIFALQLKSVLMTLYHTTKEK
jgi:hypothetical protein